MPGVISIESWPLVLYVPPTRLQSAVALNVLSALNLIWYFVWSAGGITPWNAGTFSVIEVSCQILPVSSFELLEPQAATMAVAPMASAMSVSLRM